MNLSFKLATTLPKWPNFGSPIIERGEYSPGSHLLYIRAWYSSRRERRVTAKTPRWRQFRALSNMLGCRNVTQQCAHLSNARPSLRSSRTGCNCQAADRRTVDGSTHYTCSCETSFTSHLLLFNVIFFCFFCGRASFHLLMCFFYSMFTSLKMKHGGYTCIKSMVIIYSV